MIINAKLCLNNSLVQRNCGSVQFYSCLILFKFFIYLLKWFWSGNLVSLSVIAHSFEWSVNVTTRSYVCDCTFLRWCCFVFISNCLFFSCCFFATHIPVMSKYLLCWLSLMLLYTLVLQAVFQIVTIPRCVFECWSFSLHMVFII